MTNLPVVMIHGYSATAQAFDSWQQQLQQRGYTADDINICSYVSLSNEITIHDIAEGFDRALARRLGADRQQPFDAIVHSTGMLVIRAWLTLYPEQRGRLKHLVALAPATFGSPLAHMGRSFMSAMIQEFSAHTSVFAPDFMQAGDQVLDALELGSRFTWELAGKDLLHPAPDGQPYYGRDATTPYIFIFCGDTPYMGFREFVNQPGTDGTVRLAGCALNSRQFIVDFTTRQPPPATRLQVAPWSNYDAPVHIVHGYNHGSIHQSPPDYLVDLVVEALRVASWDGEQGYTAWAERAKALTLAPETLPQQYQQFIVHAVDERGDGITDFNLQLVHVGEDGAQRIKAFDLDPHVYSSDASYRCFQVDLAELQQIDERQITLRVIASSGSQFVGYRAFASSNAAASEQALAEVSLAEFTAAQQQTANPVSLFYPFTTTLIELRLTREALPFDPTRVNNVCWFPDRDGNPLGNFTLSAALAQQEERLEQAAAALSAKLTGNQVTDHHDLLSRIKEELKHHFGLGL